LEVAVSEAVEEGGGIGEPLPEQGLAREPPAAQAPPAHQHAHPGVARGRPHTPVVHALLGPLVARERGQGGAYGELLEPLLGQVVNLWMGGRGRLKRELLRMLRNSKIYLEVASERPVLCLDLGHLIEP
jgi:hypothetical protein